MALLDLIIIIILIAFLFHGLSRGLIRTIGGLAGLAIGAFIAGKYAGIFGALFTPFVFFLIFILANRLTSMLFFFLAKVFNLIAIIPGLKIINRLAGACLGLIEGAVLIGVLLFVTQKFPLFDKWSEYFENADLVKPLSSLGELFLPLFKQLF